MSTEPRSSVGRNSYLDTQESILENRSTEALTLLGFTLSIDEVDIVEEAELRYCR